MNTTTRILAVATAASAVLISLPQALADEALPASFAECAAVTNDTARLACYDALAAGQAEQPTEPPPAAPAAPVIAVSPAPSESDGPVPITDEVGRETVDGAREEDRPEYSANVTRCEENEQSGQTYFFLENGQVWKQANYRRLRFRECRFEVTLSEDNFGYSMYIPSEDRRFRVTRIR